MKYRIFPLIIRSFTTQKIKLNVWGMLRILSSREEDQHNFLLWISTQLLVVDINTTSCCGYQHNFLLWTSTQLLVVDVPCNLETSRSLQTAPCSLSIARWPCSLQTACHVVCRLREGRFNGSMHVCALER